MRSTSSSVIIKCMLESFFNIGRRKAITSWAMNLSAVALSSFVLADVFDKLTNIGKVFVIVAGILFFVCGVLVCPDEGEK